MIRFPISDWLAHLQRIQANPPVDAVGRLAAGGAILAAAMACAGQPAFALIRPPGHHALDH